MRYRRFACTALIVGTLCVGRVLGSKPPELPGEEITSQYLQQVIPPDSIAAHAPAVPSASPTWLDEAAKSWDAPTLGEQLTADKTFVPQQLGLSDDSRELSVQIRKIDLTAPSGNVHLLYP